MLWYVQLAFSLIMSAITSKMLAPKQEQTNKDSRDLDQSEIPSAKVGGNIPVVFGRRWVTSPNVVWWHKTRTNKSGLYTKHFVDMHMAICYGPVERLERIAIDKKKPVTAAPLTLSDLLAPSELVLTVEYQEKYTNLTRIIELNRWGLKSTQYHFPHFYSPDDNPFDTYFNLKGEVSTTGFNPIIPPQNLLSSLDQVSWAHVTPIDLSATNLISEAWLPFPNSADTIGLEQKEQSVGGFPYPALAGYLNLKPGAQGWETELLFKLSYQGVTLAEKSVLQREGAGDLVFDMAGLYIAQSTIQFTGDTSIKNGITVYQSKFRAEIILGATDSSPIGTPGSAGQDDGEGGVFKRSGSIRVVLEDTAVPLPSTVPLETGLLGCVKLDMPNIFGGVSKGGGIQGEVCLLNGDVPFPERIETLNWLFGHQTSFNKALTETVYSQDYARMNANPVHYKHTVSAILKDTYVVANSGSMRSWHFQIVSRPNTLPMAEAYHAIGEYEANPAQVLFEVLTNKEWGKGLPLSQIDVASFITASKRLHEENLGISLVWTKSTEILKFMDTLVKHAYAGYRVNVFGSGLLQFHLFRENKQSRSRLHALNPIKVLAYKSKKGDKQVSDVQVKWKQGTITADIGKVTRLRDVTKIRGNNGAANTLVLDLPGIATEEAAEMIGGFHLSEGSAELKVLEYTEDVLSGNYLPGDFVVFSTPKYVDSPVLMRVTDLTIEEGIKKGVAVEDAFAKIASADDAELTLNTQAKLGVVVPSSKLLDPYEDSLGSIFIISVTPTNALAGTLDVSIVKGGILGNFTATDISGKLAPHPAVSASDSAKATFNVTAISAKGDPISTAMEVYLVPEDDKETIVLNQAISLSTGVSGTNQGLGKIVEYALPPHYYPVSAYTGLEGVSISIDEEQRKYLIQVDSLVPLWSPPHTLHIIFKDFFGREHSGTLILT